MKIIFANNYFYLKGGSERVLFGEMELLKEDGHEVIPFTRKFLRNDSSEFSEFFPENFEYENVSIRTKVSAAFKLIYSYESRDQFSKLLEFARPDIIHAHNIYGRLTTSIIDEAKKRKVPMVLTVHDYKLSCPSYLMILNGGVCNLCKGRKFYHCFHKKCHKNSYLASSIYTVESYFNQILKKYDWIRFYLCPSRFSMMKHAEAGIAENKLFHVPNFVKIEDFVPNFDPGNYLLYVGRISREKGVLTLLKAVKDVDFPVKIVGDGPKREEYERYVKENKMDNVVFEGFKSGKELESLFLNAAFLVVPSEWYEIFGLIIIEAFAYGKPVVASNIGGIPELVIDGETGLLFEAGDQEELREKAGLLLSSPNTIREMGLKARKKVEKEYNAGIHFEKLIEVYEKACS